MRRAFLIGLSAFAVSCAAAETPAPTPAPPVVAQPAIEAAAPAGVMAPACSGVLVQGGLVICTGEPGSHFTVAGTRLTVSNTGTAQFGLGTSAPPMLGWCSR